MRADKTHKSNNVAKGIKWLRETVIIYAIVIALSILPAGVSFGEPQPEPINKVVIIVDNSGSYKSRQAEAMDQAGAILEGISERKLHRWEPTSDLITLISLDAVPEVIWEGSLTELKATNPKVWVERFQARTDYAGCTDVTSAFHLAVQHLDGDPRYVHKYLFAFSDLIDEPPGESIYKPHTRSSLPTGNFPWESLQDVSVSVFWMPPDQKLTWSRAVEQQGLRSSFTLYTTSESAKVTIQPPPMATVKVTEAERAANRKKYTDKFKATGKIVGTLIGIMILLPVTIIIVSYMVRRGRPARVPAARIMQPPHPASARRLGVINPRPLGQRPAAPPGNRRNQ